MERYYRTECGHASFPADTAVAFTSIASEEQWQAVWLLRRAARDRGIADSILQAVANAAPRCRHWLAKLQVCQLFAEHPCPRRSRAKMVTFLTACFDDSRPLLRAWALSALWQVRDDTRYTVLYSKWRRLCQQERSAAVQARLRQLARQERDMKS